MAQHSPFQTSPHLPRLFVTGTDTEVGKTVVTACLAAAFPERARAAKVVASGVAPADATGGEDAALLGFAAGHAPTVFATFEAPVSPHRAAILEGRDLEVPLLTAWLRGLRGNPLLVEGVGGWRVPITPAFEVRDAARVVEAPILVVAADRLGVLNHTRLTVEAIRADGFEVVGVVLNRGGAPLPPEVDPSTTSNLEDLRSLLDVPVVPCGPVDRTDRHAMGTLGRALWRDLT
jgi:dethiobiotin synthetase